MERSEVNLISKLRSIFGDLRINRILMFILIAGSVAYGLGGTWLNVVLTGLIGATLSGAGFYMDYFADYKKDRASGKMTNPIARGSMSPRTGLSIAAVFLGTSAILSLLVNPWLLLLLGCVMLIVAGLAIGILDTPILRAFSLGALQGFYVLIGALAASRFERGVFLLVLFLLFAMTGGRVLGDMRDLPYDQKTEKMTIPKKYGIRWASYFYLVNEILAYIFGLLVYATGLLGIGYLYCIIGVIIVGVPMSLAYVRNPSPRMGNIANMLSFGILGMLFVIGLIIGKLQ
jgi:4-hydroxybenzoate polyprenyltransferase